MKGPTDGKTDTGQLDFRTGHLGVNRSRTRIGIGFLVVLSLCLLVAFFLPNSVLTDDEQRFLLWVVNGFAGGVLFTIFLASPLAVAYGFWNGGPVLSGSIAVVPVLIGHAIGGQFASTIDLTIAFAGGGCAVGVATARTMYAGATHREVQPVPAFTQTVWFGLSLTVMTLTIAGTLLWRLIQSSGPHVSVGLWVSGAFLTLGVLALTVVVLFAVIPERIPVRDE